MAKGNTWFLNIRAKGVKEASGDVNKLKKDMNGLGSTVKKLAVGFGALYLGKSLVGAAQGAIDTAAQFEVLQLRLENMYGSAEKGKQVFGEFAKIAATTPFELANVVEAGAALKAFGSKAEDTLKPVADLAAFMGVDVVEAANAVGRAFAGGAGAADVLRDRGILQLIKDSQGIVDLTSFTLPEFRDAMFKTLTDPTVGIAGATNKLAKTWSGMVSNFKDSMSMIRAAIGAKFIEKLKPLISNINKELSAMGDIGWEYVGESFIQNWKEIFTQIAVVFVEAGVLLGKGLLLGIKTAWNDGVGDLIDPIANFGTEIHRRVMGDMLPDLLEEVNEISEEKSKQAPAELAKEFQRRINDIKIDFTELFTDIKNDAEKLSDTDIVPFKPTPTPSFGPDMDPSLFTNVDDTETQAKKYISILEAQTTKISNSLNKQVEEFIKYGVSEADAQTWKEEQLGLHLKKLEDAKEAHRLKTLEENIVASDEAELEFEKFQFGLEKRITELRKAGVTEVEIEKWKTEQIAKWQKQDLESRLQVGSKLLGALASLNSASKGSALVTARLQQAQALVNTYSAATAAITPPPVGYGPTPLGYTAMAAAIVTGLANVVQIENSMKSFATGGSFVTSGSEAIMVGDNPSGRELVNVTPLDAAGEPTGGSGAINVNISGSVMSENYTEDIIIPHIKSALRRGEIIT